MEKIHELQKETHCTVKFDANQTCRQDEIMSKETGTQAAFERSAAIFMAFVCAVSLLAAAGWLFNRPILASLRPEYIPMAPATALIFLGLCAAWLVHRYFSARRGMRILLQTALLGILIIVVILALRYFTGLGPDLEKMLYPAPALFGKFTSARMSPLSALGFLLAIPVFLLLTGARLGQRVDSLARVDGQVVSALGANAQVVAD